MRILLTNDDGIQAAGLHALRRALLEVPGVELAVVAPDGNRSATARSITTRRPLTVREVELDDGTLGRAVDGTPVDCVRLTQLGLLDGFVPELVVAGINHGANLGDDVTYSGTVAAALEAIMLGLPGIAVSQQSQARDLDMRAGERFDFTAAAAFAAGLVQRLVDGHAGELREGTLLNINVPGATPEGVEVVRLGKRVYGDALTIIDETPGERRYEIYGDPGSLEDGSDGREDTDVRAVLRGHIAVTPMHFELTDVAGMDALARADLAALLAPVTEEVETR